MSNGMQSLLRNVGGAVALDISTVSDNTAQVGNIIDMQGAKSCLFSILTGTLADADATFAVLIEEGDAANLSDAAAVADADLISASGTGAPETEAGFSFSDDDAFEGIEYTGSKRYVRLTVTPANNTGSATFGATALKTLKQKGVG